MSCEDGWGDQVCVALLSVFVCVCVCGRESSRVLFGGMSSHVRMNLRFVLAFILQLLVCVHARVPFGAMIKCHACSDSYIGNFVRFFGWFDKQLHQLAKCLDEITGLQQGASHGLSGPMPR